MVPMILTWLSQQVCWGPEALACRAGVQGSVSPSPHLHVALGLDCLALPMSAPPKSALLGGRARLAESLDLSQEVEEPSPAASDCCHVPSAAWSLVPPRLPTTWHPRDRCAAAVPAAILGRGPLPLSGPSIVPTHHPAP